MNSDLTFFTNEANRTLLDRFKEKFKHIKELDVLIGYFRISGFHLLSDELFNLDKIRILVGLNTDDETQRLIHKAEIQSNSSFISDNTVKETTKIKLTEEYEYSSLDNLSNEDKVLKGSKEFIALLQSGKLEMKAHPEKIHAKVYIGKYCGTTDHVGSVITGSSNFSYSGLQGNREFNVELKDSRDVQFALEEFEKLWSEAIDIKDEIQDVLTNKTWLNDSTTPYQIYLKVLYEYFKEDINQDQEAKLDLFMPEDFMKLEYQEQAVKSAEKILNTYDGVFLADVVGLGKTFISALLAQRLQGNILIICPPHLIKYWEDTFRDFDVRRTKVESLGKLEHIINEGNYEKYKYIFIDEAHRFRNESTQSYELLHKICFGKKVILVSATPLNNRIEDIASQIKLFQAPKQCTIPAIKDLDRFFSDLSKRLKTLEKGTIEYSNELKEVSREIRSKLLRHIMVRRTRTEVKKHFSDDIKKQKLFFPELESPERIVYKFDEKLNFVFNQTIELLKSFKYSRYTPKLYLKQQLAAFESQAERNIGGFMKGILVKRLESSFYAFKLSLSRFITSYEQFIAMFKKGTVLISKKVNVYDLLEIDDQEKIEQLVSDEKVQQYSSNEFTDDFMRSLEGDLETLKHIEKLWINTKQDPKLDKFIEELENHKKLKNKQIIIFTESKETGEYLYKSLNRNFPSEVLFYSSQGAKHELNYEASYVPRDIIKQNFDPNSKKQLNDLKILITTDVLAEGINLHRSNIVINYDLPWNPTRVLQRVGRVNRVGTKHKTINIFNFFPTDQSDEHLGLEDNIKSKIQAFHDMLGEDAKYLSDDEEVSSHNLFGDKLYEKLNDKNTYDDEREEEQTELEYLSEIRKIRDEKPELFSKIKYLPKKSRSCKAHEIEKDSLISFFRKGRIKKFILSEPNSKSLELDFYSAVRFLRCNEDTKRISIPKEYFELLNKNKDSFLDLISPEETELKGQIHGSKSHTTQILRTLKSSEFRQYHGFTEEEEDFIKDVQEALEDGIIPSNTTKKINAEIKKIESPIAVLSILRKYIDKERLNQYNLSKSQKNIKDDSPMEIILSEYLMGSNL